MIYNRKNHYNLRVMELLVLTLACALCACAATDVSSPSGKQENPPVESAAPAAEPQQTEEASAESAETPQTWMELAPGETYYIEVYEENGSVYRADTGEKLR